MRGKQVRGLLAAGRPGAGEARRLALASVLAGGAALAAVALLGTSGYLISRAAQRPPILALMVTIVAVRAFGLTRALMRYGERLTSHDLALRQLTRLRRRFYRSLVPLVPGGLPERSGDLLSRFVDDIDTLKDLHLRVVIPAFVSLIVLVAATLAATLMLPSAGLTMLAVLTIAVLLLPWLGVKAAGRAARRQSPSRARLTNELIEAIDGAAELTVATAAAERVQRIAATDRELAHIARADAIASSAGTVAGGLLAGAGLLALLVVGVPAVHEGKLSAVLLAALVFVLLAANDSIQPLAGAGRSLRMCAAAAGRLGDIDARRAPVLEPLSAQHPVCAGDLRAEGISFRYQPGQPLVLDELELVVGAGEDVAIVGPSGAGKSTLAELLVRFADPSHGRLTLDGIDLRELTGARVRERVLLCSQDCRVFNTTIRENLLIARGQATAAELFEALAIVELDGWVQDLPQGLDTVIGQGGELASGGQRRRIALARALLSDASFLILDEPTAHLDPALARRVTAAVLGSRADRATIVITHDEMLLDQFDRVLELRAGRLYEPPAVRAR